MSDKSVWSETTVTSWDLICENEEKKALPDELYMAGMAVSMLTMGGVSDMYGRKTTLFWCQVQN